MKTHQLKRADGKIFKVKILTPQTPPLGLVVVSPGAGGSENGYGYLVDYFATHGWFVPWNTLRATLIPCGSTLNTKD